MFDKVLCLGASQHEYGHVKGARLRDKVPEEEHEHDRIRIYVTGIGACVHQNQPAMLKRLSAIFTMRPVLRLA